MIVLWKLSFHFTIQKWLLTFAMLLKLRAEKLWSQQLSGFLQIAKSNYKALVWCWGQTLSKAMGMQRNGGRLSIFFYSAINTIMATKYASSLRRQTLCYQLVIAKCIESRKELSLKEEQPPIKTHDITSLYSAAISLLSGFLQAVFHLSARSNSSV